MGLIIDSSLLVSAERSGQNARQSLTTITSQIGETEIALSVVTLIELAHGAARADNTERRETRGRFIEDLILGVPVHPISTAIALLAGKIDGESHTRGFAVPLADLLIGVTALDLGYGVATTNARHFRMIPGLMVLQL